MQERYDLIARNTEEIVQEEELKTLLKRKKPPHAYIGFACTGRMHIGYMVPVRKIVDFLHAGCKFTFLIADLHAYLDDSKTPWDLLDARFAYYKAGITGLLEAFGAPLDQVAFVRGSDFELERDYMASVLHMAGEVTLNRARRAAAEVVRFKEDPRLGGFVYPLLQIEDVYALDCDIALGGIDQRGIYMLGRDVAERMGRDKYVCVFTPLLPGLTGSKMSASDAKSKVDLLDSDEEVARKIKKAHCPEKEVEGNGVLAFFEHVIFPHLEGEPLLVERPEKFGGSLSYADYGQLVRSYKEGAVHPLDLKNALTDHVLQLLSVARPRITDDLVAAAYPEGHKD